MCGIAGIHFKNVGKHTRADVDKAIDALLLGIESRGRDATGMVAVPHDLRKKVFHKLPLRASHYIQARPDVPENPRTIMLHTRWATQGLPHLNDNNHPVKYGNTFVVHNGHINNDTKLFDANKLRRHAEVDTEIIPALIDKHGLDKIHMALKELEGGFAIGAIDPKRYKNHLVLAKGPSSPLMYVDTEDFVMWCSEKSPVEKAAEILGLKINWGGIDSLDPGEMLYIEEGAVSGFEFPLFKVETKKPYGFTHHDAAKPTSKPAAEPHTSGCKGCGHNINMHTSEKKCIGSQRCNCRGYVPRHRPKGASVINADNEKENIVSYIGINGVRHGITEYGTLINMQSGEIVEWPEGQKLKDEWDEPTLCGCKHRQPYHVGMSRECEYPGCACKEFLDLSKNEPLPIGNCMVVVEKQEETETEVVEAELPCESCGEWTTEKDGEYLAELWLCPDCLTYWDTYITEAKDVPTTGEVIDMAQRKDEKEEKKKEDQAVWERVAKEERMRHLTCLGMVSEKTGYSPTLIEWMLFHCPMEMLDDEQWLMDAREQLDTLYGDAEEAVLKDDAAMMH